jgi:PAS domain S-box-containing protein
MKPYNPTPGWSIERKVFAGFVAAFSVLLAAGWLVARAASDYLQANREVEHTHRVLDRLNNLDSNFYRAEANQRDYFISNRQSFLDERDAAIGEARQVLPHLRELTADNPGQQARLLELQKLFEQRLVLFEKRLALFRQEGMAGLQEDHVWAVQLDKQIDAVIAAALLEEQGLLEQRNREAERFAGQSRYIYLGLLTIVTTLMTAMLFGLRRELVERTRLQRAVQDSERQLNAILDNAPQIVFLKDLQGRYQFGNKAFLNLLGLRLGDLKSATDKDVFPSEVVQQLRADDRAAVAHGSALTQRERIPVGGAMRLFETVKFPLFDADGVCRMVCGIAQDITQRDDAERDLTAANRRENTFHEVLSLFSAGFERTLILGKVLDLFAEYHDLPVSAFYRHDEWSGSLVLDASRGAPPHLPNALPLHGGLLGEAARARRVLLLENCQALALNIDAGLYNFHPAGVILAPVRYQDKLLGILALASTQPIGTHEQTFVERVAVAVGIGLHNLHQYDDMRQLTEQLHLRGREIGEKNRQLEEASRMKSEFLANMSHELRTPLNAIIGFADVLRDGLAGEVSARQSDYLSEIAASGQHLLALINDILDLSKIEAGRMTLELESVDPGALLSNSLSIVREKASAHRIELRCEIPERMEALQADPRKLKQIVYNYLSNALKFTPDGGQVTLRAARLQRDAAQAKIRRTQFGAELEPSWNEYLEIEVEDTGIGIRSADITRLFQPFSQIDSALSRQYQGTGLGLAMVKRLAELHGGAVALDTRPGAGSCFRVYLPWRNENLALAEEAAERTPSENVSGEEPTQVLVIEDESSAVELIRLQLAQGNFRLVTAGSAEQALEILKGTRPDLIVLDILLPGMDGWEFLQRAKSTPGINNIPVVIVSIVADTRRGLSLGAARVLQKPLQDGELLRAVSDLGLTPGAVPPQPVLIVDDDPKAVEIIAMRLTEAGYPVLRAYGGRDGIDTARANRPGLIVLDLLMPEVSGFDVVEALKTEPGTATIPILVLTAKLLGANERALLNGHVQRIVAKSEFNQGRFLSEVRRALAHSIPKQENTP